MIIHTPELIEQNGEICVQAQVELVEHGVTAPKELWFRFPKSHRKYVTDRADGFAVSMLLVAMELGEDMEVRGVLSPRLLYGMQDYQRFYNRMFPERFKLVDVKCENLRPVEPDKVQGGVGCAFSGGVDSFFTLWSHLPKNETKTPYRLTHCFFIQGCDLGLRLTNDDLYSRALHDYRSLMEKLGLELLTARTNARCFSSTLQSYFFLGTTLIGTVLFLGSLFSHFYIASAKPYESSGVSVSGLDSRIDHLLTTEGLEIMHCGAWLSRFEKLVRLAQWSQTYPLLRVCGNANRPKGVLNCCRCEKCLRTMVSLDILGALSKYTSFHLPLRYLDILRCRVRDHAETFGFWIEIRQQAIKTKRCGLAIAISFCLSRSRVRSLRKGIERWAWRIYLQLKSLLLVQIVDKERN